MDNQGEVATISYEKIHTLSLSILKLLCDESAGHVLLACGLTMSRLCNPITRLPIELEAKFLSDVMDWVAAYWATQPGEKPN